MRLNKNMVINLPKKVKYIIDRLKSFGYEAYAVGGCVRDSLLGKTPEDWDICTNALPEEIKTAFFDVRVIETGIKHGTVSVILEHEPFEITTYRTEGNYSDNRRPDSVSFVKNLCEDLARRDFTVNAMAYNDEAGLIDIFGGQADLENKIIRSVGNPYERFAEDALRIMRAVRFCATLGFVIEAETKKAVLSEKERIKNIAIERVNVEFIKTVLSDNPIRLYEHKDVIAEFLENALSLDEISCKALGLLKKDKALRLFAVMCSIYPHEDSENKIKSALKELKTDTKTIKRVLNIASAYKKEIPYDLITARKMVSQHDFEAVFDSIEIKKAFALVRGEKETVAKCDTAIYFLNEIRKKKLCTKISELEIDGIQLQSMGIKGRLIGDALCKLLLAVIEERTENDNKALSAYCKKYIKGNEEK